MKENIGNWLLAIIQLVISGFLGILGFMFKKEISRVDNLEKNQMDIARDLSENYVKKSDIPSDKEIINAIKNLEIKMAEEYITKEEATRNFGEMTKKMDKIYELLLERSK